MITGRNNVRIFSDTTMPCTDIFQLNVLDIINQCLQFHQRLFVHIRILGKKIKKTISTFFISSVTLSVPLHLSSYFLSTLSGSIPQTGF